MAWLDSVDAMFSYTRVLIQIISMTPSVAKRVNRFLKTNVYDTVVNSEYRKRSS
jgi:hypothetical protein